MLGSRGEPYIRRRPLPALLLIGTLAMASIVAWTVALSSGGDDSRVSCAAPKPLAVAPGSGATTAPAPLGAVLPRDALDDQPALALRNVRLRVLNATGERGRANLVTSELADLGFSNFATPGNDPVYAAQRLDCYGQIRFGAAGLSAARTVSIAVPCAELVRDGRPDASVDVVVGRQLDRVGPTKANRTILETLKQGQRLDADALHGARDADC